MRARSSKGLGRGPLRPRRPPSVPRDREASSALQWASLGRGRCAPLSALVYAKKWFMELRLVVSEVSGGPLPPLVSRRQGGTFDQFPRSWSCRGGGVPA